MKQSYKDNIEKTLSEFEYKGWKISSINKDEDGDKFKCQILLEHSETNYDKKKINLTFHTPQASINDQILDKIDWIKQIVDL